MIKNTQKHTLQNKTISFLMIVAFLFTSIIPPTKGYAQSVLSLPYPGAMVYTSLGYIPPVLKGIKVFPDEPFRFEFYIDSGESQFSQKELKPLSSKLIKYFLASLTVPEDELWVNLSPHEKDHIIPEDFGITEMGRDMLAQDYILKQLTASLIYPEDDLGQEFWDKVYKRAYELYGTTDIPINTFNKVWIVPDRAVVYENGNTAFVVESHLKAMLEEDYVTLEHNLYNKERGMDRLATEQVKEISAVSSEIVREVVIPLIEKEINEGENFAQLRQIFYSLILATWFKRNLQDNLISQIYVDQNKVAGIDVEDKEIKEKIYQQYLKAYKRGVYDFIREDYDPYSQQVIPRKYFSGGVSARIPESVMIITDSAMMTEDSFKGTVFRVSGRYGRSKKKDEESSDPSMLVTFDDLWEEIEEREEGKKNGLNYVIEEKRIELNKGGAKASLEDAFNAVLQEDKELRELVGSILKDKLSPKDRSNVDILLTNSSIGIMSILSSFTGETSAGDRSMFAIDVAKPVSGVFKERRIKRIFAAFRPEDRDFTSEANELRKFILTRNPREDLEQIATELGEGDDSLYGSKRMAKQFLVAARLAAKHGLSINETRLLISFLDKKIVTGNILFRYGDRPKDQRRANRIISEAIALYYGIDAFEFHKKVEMDYRNIMKAPAIIQQSHNFPIDEELVPTGLLNADGVLGIDVFDHGSETMKVFEKVTAFSKQYYAFYIARKGEDDRIIFEVFRRIGGQERVEIVNQDELPDSVKSEFGIDRAMLGEDVVDLMKADLSDYVFYPTQGLRKELQLKVPSQGGFALRLDVLEKMGNQRLPVFLDKYQSRVLEMFVDENDLKITDGVKEKVIPMPTGKQAQRFIVGRGEKQEINPDFEVLEGFISRHHFEVRIESHENGIWVVFRDMGSKQGTYLSYQVIEQLKTVMNIPSPADLILPDEVVKKLSEPKSGTVGTVIVDDQKSDAPVYPVRDDVLEVIDKRNGKPTLRINRKQDVQGHWEFQLASDIKAVNFAGQDPSRYEAILKTLEVILGLAFNDDETYRKSLLSQASQLPSIKMARGYHNIVDVSPADVVKISSTKQAEPVHLGRNQESFQLERKFDGESWEAWIKAGTHSYKLWIEDESINFQQYDQKDGTAMGDVQRISKGREYLVGRSEDNDFQFAADASLSREHFSFKVYKSKLGQYVLEITDRLSSNGTTVDSIVTSDLPEPLEEKVRDYFLEEGMNRLDQYVDSDYMRDVIRTLGNKSGREVNLLNSLKEYLELVDTFEKSNDMKELKDTLRQLVDRRGSYKFSKAVNLGRLKVYSRKLRKMFFDEKETITQLDPRKTDFRFTPIQSDEAQSPQDFMKLVNAKSDKEKKENLYIFSKVYEWHDRQFLLAARGGRFEIYYTSDTYSHIAGQYQWSRQEAILIYLDEHGKLILEWFAKPIVESAHDLTDAASAEINSLMAGGELVVQPEDEDTQDFLGQLHVDLGLAVDENGVFMSRDPITKKPQQGNKLGLEVQRGRHAGFYFMKEQKPEVDGEKLEFIVQNEKLKHLGLSPEDNAMLTKQRQLVTYDSIDEALLHYQGFDVIEEIGEGGVANIFKARQKQTPGGIDFNPSNLDLQVEGRESDLPFNRIPQDVEQMNIQGFYPVIFSITPVTNIPLILGVNREQENEQLSFLP